MDSNARPSIDLNDPVVAQYLRDRARQAAIDGTAVSFETHEDPMTQNERSMAITAATFNSTLGMAAMKYADHAAELSRAGDHEGAKRAARTANRLSMGAIAVGMGVALAVLAALYFGA